MTRIIKQAAVTISFILFFACNQKPASSNEETKMAAPAPPSPSVDARLYLLYSDISALNNDLKKLVNLPRAQKLVFQFYYKSNGQLVLGAFAGKLLNTVFETSFVPIIDTIDLTSAGVTYQDISGKDIYLGDQEVANNIHTRPFRILKDFLNGPHNDKYLVFVPKILPSDGIPSRSMVTYLLVSMIDKPSTKQVYDSLISLPMPILKDSSFILPGGSIPTNPSPPRGGN